MQKDGRASRCVAAWPVLLTPPRFHRAHLKHIRLLQHCQGPVMRERPVCLMLCGGRLVAALSHPSPQETLSSLIRNRTRCLRSQAPADIFPSCCGLNAHRIYNGSICLCGLILLLRREPYITIRRRGTPTSSHLTYIRNSGTVN